MRRRRDEDEPRAFDYEPDHFEPYRLYDPARNEDDDEDEAEEAPAPGESHRRAPAPITRATVLSGRVRGDVRLPDREAKCDSPGRGSPSEGSPGDPLSRVVDRWEIL